ncbi:replication protein A 70 kDa dna-binding subunit C-like, partial [Trifolium medium]|nr:replication protein A 70 kDa dna-binding subunit C-like [Trifolium medium]
MARKFESVKDINDGKDLWKISVKIREKWSNSKDGKQSIELLVVDDKGDDISVFIPHEVIQNSEKLIELTVNNTYTMQNFQVSKNDDLYKASHHVYKLRFNGGTIVKDVNVHKIADPVTNCKPFIQIANLDFREDLLYDVIGLVDQVGYSQPNPGNRKVQVNLTLKDLSNTPIACTLWENYAHKFFNVQDQAKGDPIIVFMKYAKIKKEGKWPLTISNTWSTTKLFINEDVPEIVEFKKSLLAGIENGTVDRFAETPTQMMSQSYGSSQYTPQQAFTNNAELITLGKMVQLPM